MKQTLLFLILALFTTATFAQQLTYDPPVIDVSGEIDEDETPGFDYKGFAVVSNDTESEVVIKWLRTNIDMPAEWETQICDNSQCWSPVVSSNIDEELQIDFPITLAPGAATNLDVYLNANGVAGTGSVDVVVSPADDPETTLTLGTYNFDIAGPTSVSDAEKAAIKVFPNPTADYFEVANGTPVNEIVVYNIVGRAVKSFNAFAGNRYYLNELPTGMYLVSLLGMEGDVIKTIRLSKRSIMP